MNARRKISGITVECIQGNIVNQPDVAAIVNAANAQLRMGGGVAGAIHRAAGPGLEAECRPFAPIEPGEAVVTGACDLPNEYVIHCLGPVYGVDKPEDKLLADCYLNALEISEKKKITSIAFCAISTGVFGYPVKEAAEVAFTAIKEMIPKLNSIKTIRFVLYTDADCKIHEETMARILT